MFPGVSQAMNYPNFFYGLQSPYSVQGFYLPPIFANHEFLVSPTQIKEEACITERSLISTQNGQFGIEKVLETENSKSQSISESTYVQKKKAQTHDELLQKAFQKSKTYSVQKFKKQEPKKKKKIQKKDKLYVAKQYPKQQSSINCRYIQKNFELNIINQVFSFVWSQEKSRAYVLKMLNCQAKTCLFYEYAKTVRKYCKRYINKEYLMDLCDFGPSHIAYKMVTKNQKKLEYLSMAEFSKCVRTLIHKYLYELCPQSILTSKKMRSEIWRSHLSKCRLLRDYIFNGLDSQQYEIMIFPESKRGKKRHQATTQDSENQSN